MAEQAPDKQRSGQHGQLGSTGANRTGDCGTVDIFGLSKYADLFASSMHSSASCPHTKHFMAPYMRPESILSPPPSRHGE